MAWREAYLAFARLSEEPFHWCFLPNASSVLSAAPSALDKEFWRETAAKDGLKKT